MSALESSHGGATCSEHDLVAAVRTGDDRAFGELYERYGRRIVSYVFGMVGDHGRAEDITQEVFISALRRMRETERPIAFKPWIYEIARNACIDEFRRARRVREVPLAIDDDDPGEADRRLVSRTDSPDATFERRQKLDDLRGAFRGLSDNHHKLIVMRELEGLSYDEIGKRMGMTRPIVESTLFRARRRLNDEYQEIASGRRCEQVHAVIEGGAKSVNSLGIKERRRFARHVAHCQPCRRFARAEGFDDSVLQVPGVASKIAALLPIPAFLRWRRGGGGGGGEGESTTSVGSHSFGALQSVQTVAQYVDPASPAVGLGRAAAAVAAVVIAGGGVVGGLSVANSNSKPHASNSAPRIAHAATDSRAGDEPRAAATRAQVPTGTPNFRVASAKGNRTAGSSKRASTTATSSGVGSSSESSLSRLSGSATSTALDRAGIGPSGGGSTTPSLPKLPLPTTNSLPSLPPVSLPVHLRPINVPETVEKAVGTASKTVGGAVNTLKGVL
jgi:RNA polymerase sigma factor (sigma-70 family)